MITEHAQRFSAACTVAALAMVLHITAAGADAPERSRSIHDDSGKVTIDLAQDGTKRFTFTPAESTSKIVEANGGFLVFDQNGALVSARPPIVIRDPSGSSEIVDIRVKAGAATVDAAPHLAGKIAPGALFPSGLIDPRSVTEKWVRGNKAHRGGYTVSFKLTAAGRFAAMYNPHLVIGPGYKDLKNHYPRSMSAPTMFQQWECHVLGVFGSFTFDLEGWRSSKPNWRRTEIWTALKRAVKKKDARAVARACNWR